MAAWRCDRSSSKGQAAWSVINSVSGGFETLTPACCGASMIPHVTLLFSSCEWLATRVSQQLPIDSNLADLLVSNQKKFVTPPLTSADSHIVKNWTTSPARIRYL